MSTPMAIEPERGTSRLDRVLGVLALLVAIPVARRLRLGVLTMIVGLLKRCCWRTATAVQASAAVHAVRDSALRLPGRIACLEVSLASVVSLGVRGRSVEWCIGIAATPYAAHAWIAVGGKPVAEPPEVQAIYQLLLVV